MLVERGADSLVARRSNGTTALHVAAQDGKIKVCRYLVEECDFDVNAMTSGKFHVTPLYHAAGGDNLEVCKYLVGKGSKVDAGNQPLVIAAQVNLLFIILRMFLKFRYLLRQGADPLWQSNNGDCARTM